MSKIKLIAMDLDGTLLSSDLAISPRTKQVIKKVREKGIHVTIATGRMFTSALVYAEELDLDVPLITYQGALVKTSRSGQVLYRRNMPLDLARKVIQEAGERGFHVNVYIEDQLYVKSITERAMEYARLARVPIHPVGNLAEFVKSDPIKVLVVGEEDELDAWAKVCRAHFQDSLYITKSQYNYLEFLHPEATKGIGLRNVAQFLGIPPGEVMAIGDSYNDLEMFQYAGIAVAMGNSREEIRAAATYVTAGNDADGVAEILERLIIA
ncbi:MAG: Cof-type HAD-IIB family hydrolase [Bacillota bacterium]